MLFFKRSVISIKQTPKAERKSRPRMPRGKNILILWLEKFANAFCRKVLLLRQTKPKPKKVIIGQRYGESSTRYQSLFL